MVISQQVTQFCVIKILNFIHNAHYMKIIFHYLSKQTIYIKSESFHFSYFLISRSKNDILFYFKMITSERWSRLVSDQQLHSIKVKCLVAVCKMFSFYTFIDAQSVQKAVIRINKFVLCIITRRTKQSAFAGMLYIVCCVLWSLRW